MVDFKKLLDKEKRPRSGDPLNIFNDLDRESGKEYLRPAQESVLKEWYSKLREQRDIIVKLHTGQGKTLIGLLMLQSSITEGKGPAIYLCPNNYLITQTVDQANSFGIETVQFGTDSSGFPKKFLNSEAILVTNCNKLFNGKSVFGVAGSPREPIPLGAVVMDDAHKCLDIIRGSCSAMIKIDPEDSSNPLYEELWVLFEESLKRQAPGTCREIRDGREECSMAVPFWTWHDRREEVLEVLLKYKEANELLFVWDLLKDKIDQCMCIFSGRRLEITPRLLPIDMFPSFAQAQRRFFLSATLTEDAVLVRDLGIQPKSVSNPLIYNEIKYSGERLILIPTLVNTELERKTVISWLSKFAAKHGNFGVVSIVPSFRHATDWENAGGDKADVKTLYPKIEELKVKVRKKTAKKILVLVNEYDGVDLPDSTCRLLCLDSLPSYNSLMDRYTRDARTDSRVIQRQLAQRVEQGIGRAIRGSNDWCIVVITGNNLTNFLSQDFKRKYLSNEAQMQINIGEELALEVKTEGNQLGTIEKLINQCLDRDSLWKDYYKDRMSKVENVRPSEEYLDRAVSEREAEVLFQQGQLPQAIEALQSLVALSEKIDQGWYLQLMATYLYPIDRTKSMDKQSKAYTLNPRLFRPEAGISYSKLISTGTRGSRLLELIKKYESHNALIVAIMSTMDKVSLNSPSDLFEDGICELGELMGFLADRPEKTSGRGPDNLWQIDNKNFWIIECKHQVSGGRNEISKSEVGQLSNSIGWFKANYEEYIGWPVLIHPTKVLAKDAYETDVFYVLRPPSLETLKKNIINFYNSLKEIPSDTITQDKISMELKKHNLDTENLIKQYLQRIEKHK